MAAASASSLLSFHSSSLLRRSTLLSLRSISSSLSFSSSPSLYSVSISSPIPLRSSSSSSSSSNFPSTFYASAASAGAKKRVLIVNTNSGGHAVIGFYFARQLLESGHAVTILTVGEEGSDKMKKPPFTRFSEIVSAGGCTVWGDPAEVGRVVGDASFDVVLENNGKDLDTVRPVADWAKSTGVQQFLYISSAGIYKTTDEPPHVEGDTVNDEASHVAVEKYISGLSFSSCSIFRPQYMTGFGNNKDCEEWFFDSMDLFCIL